VKFEWDEVKAENNLRKHGVAFDVAIRLFRDPLRIEEPDGGDHGEERWKTIGFVNAEEIVVIYTERADLVRIISARKAETNERKEYWKNRHV